MTVQSPYLKRCCNRFSLRFGSKVVGWYNLASSVFGILIVFYSLGDVSNKGRYPEVAADLINLKLIFCLLDVVLSVLLLVGLHQKHPHHYLAWIIAKSLILLCEIPLYFVMSNFDRLCRDFGFFMLLFGVDVYGVLVVHGYFMEVTSPEVLSNPEETEA